MLGYYKHQLRLACAATAKDAELVLYGNQTRNNHIELSKEFSTNTLYVIKQGKAYLYNRFNPEEIIL